MSQNDYLISDQSGASFLIDLNSLSSAIVSNNSGATEPPTMYAFQWWADTTSGLLKLRNTANNGWVTIGSLADANLGLLSKAGGTMTGALVVDDLLTVTGNVGIGVTTETGWQDYTALRVGGVTSLWGSTTKAANGFTQFGNNVYRDSSGIDKYIVADEASKYRQGAGGHVFSVAPSGSADAAISFTDTFTIGASGKVTATTAAAGYAASITNTNSASDSNGLLIKAGTTATEYALRVTNTAGSAYFLSVKGDGNVLVGTSTGSGLGGTGNTGISLSASQNQIIVQTGSDASLYLNRTGSNGAVQEFRKDGSTVGSISVTASSTSYNETSDYRLKTDVKPMTNAIATFKQLKPSNFEWIADGSRVDGFIAHELQEVIPESVTGTKDAMRDEEYEVKAAVYKDVVTSAIEAVEPTFDDEGLEIMPAVEAQEETTESVIKTPAVMGTRSVPDMQGIDKSKIVPLLTAALQEAIAKIESLETRLTALE